MDLRVVSPLYGLQGLPDHRPDPDRATTRHIYGTRKIRGLAMHGGTRCVLGCKSYFTCCTENASAKLYKVIVYETDIFTPFVSIVDIHCHAGRSKRVVFRVRRLS